MSRSRRLAGWRLAAIAAIVSALTAGTVFAQTMQVRVKVGPANIYDKQRTSSDVVMTVTEGAVLDVLNRDRAWYWVLLPADGNGVRRGGYIPSYLVELVTAKGRAVPDLAPQPLPRGLRPPTTAPVRVPHYFFGLGGGGQSASPLFADSSSYPLYDETGQYQATYTTARASALDATVGLRLSPTFVLGVALWRSTSVPTAALTAIVPHPFSYDTPRLTTADDLVVGRSENDGHLQLTWLVPVGRHSDLSIFAGPSLFYLRQDVVSSLSFRETYPYDTVSVSAFQVQRRAKVGFGANAGADLTIMVWRFIGVGVGGRYARGSVTMPGATADSVKVKVGGAQVSGGVRIRF
jgi:hypothetical protein